jgi:hypothetical protein
MKGRKGIRPRVPFYSSLLPLLLLPMRELVKRQDSAKIAKDSVGPTGDVMPM